MSRKANACVRCRYARLCNGHTMTDFTRCPEWVIAEARNAAVGVREWTHGQKGACRA